MALPASSRLAAQPDFTDGLGVRVRLAEKGGELLEMLRVVPEFAGVPAFEKALRERVSRLANFRHAYYARIRRVDRLEGGTGLGVVSERPAGARLSHVLAVAERHRLDLDINAALCLVRQLVPALAMLHQNARDVSHGALAPERIVITPLARIVITDYVLGSALEALRLSRERLWKDLRIAVPPGAGNPRLDHRADVMQLGIVALSLVLGRPIRRDELRSVPELVGSATETTVLGERTPLSPPLRRWLTRALQADARGAFDSAAQAQQSLEEDVLSGEGGYIAAPIALETFLSRYQECAVLGVDDELNDAEDSKEPAVAVEPQAPTRVTTPAPAPVPAAPAPPPPVPKPVPRPVSSRPAAAPPSEPVAAAFRPVSPEVLQPLADSPQLESEPVRPRSAPAADPVAAAQHELSREVAAAAAASHMFGGAADTATAPSVVRPQEGGRSDRRRNLERIALLVLAAIAIVQSIFIAWKTDAASFITGGTATVNIDSRPANAQVVIDGQVRGSTPISLRLGAGAHVLELRAGNEARVLPITVQANITYAQYVELPSARVKGSLEIREPAGARVLVDGRLRGTVPLRIGDLEPGSHEVVLEHRGVRSRRTVDVQPGLTATLAPAPAAQAAATLATDAAVTSGTGWLTVKAPYEMQVLEGGRTLGTTARERMELPAGRHVIEIVSETLGLRQTRSVDVTGGNESVVTINLPTGQLTLVATPPAEVFVDGERAGETPILNMPVAVGPHEVTFRHPEFGEEHRAVTVAAGTPARLDVKFKDAASPPQQ
jgi:hypothetical protein